MMNVIFKRVIAPAIFLLALAAQPNAEAALVNDLQAANTDALALESYLGGLQLSADGVCGPLAQANNMARDLVNSITAINSSLAAPLQVDADVLAGIEGLAGTVSRLSVEAATLSVDLQTLSMLANAFTIKDGITAMLQLSDEIGTMADRIGEMADNILVMSDNIGLMADRILLTQEIQNQNLATTNDNILATQTNVLALVSVAETISYDLTLDNLMAQGNALAAEMAAIVFNPWTMKTKLATVAADVRTFRDQVLAFSNVVNTDLASGTFYVTADTLVKLANLPLMMASLTTAVDGYVVAINGMQALTSSASLYDAMQSMLQLSADIGVMADRILEEADSILAMADNIGLQADQIVATQIAMSGQFSAIQTSIMGAQSMAVSLIAMRFLEY